MEQKFYDKEYYESGVESGKSLYRNYRWMPEMTIPMAMIMIDYLRIGPSDSILDFGCAKGYMVKALRLLNRQAYGYDQSEYAISEVDKEIQNFCTFDDTVLCTDYDYIISKDVFEHLTEEQLNRLLQKLNFKTLFVIVPLGDADGYFAPANNMDKSHIICKDRNWWNELFLNNNLHIHNFTYNIKGIKDSYYEKYPTAHGFWALTK